MFSDSGSGLKNSGAGTGSKSPFRNPLLYSSLALAAAVLVVGGIFFFRWQENRDIDRRTKEQRAEKQRENDRRALEQFGGTNMEIQSFYASPGTVRRGESVKLCYGVANAKKVKLEPQSNPVWPSYSRCVDVSPAKETTYTLTIEDAAGNSKTSALVVKVR